MKHLLYSQDKEQIIKSFDNFDAEKLKTEIKEWLINNPTDTVEHCKEYSKEDREKYLGYDIINFYENSRSGKPCLIVLRGE